MPSDDRFERVSVVKKANVFFDGRCVSHTVFTADGARKSVGVILPGALTFETAAPEVMEIVAGRCRVKLAGSPRHERLRAGPAVLGAREQQLPASRRSSRCTTSVTSAERAPGARSRASYQSFTDLLLPFRRPIGRPCRVNNTRFNWVNASVLVSTPIAAVVLAAWYVSSQGFVWTDLVPFVAMYFLTGLAITAGYHRYYAHRTYDCHPLVQALVLIFGAAALQNSALAWVSDHRSHHRHVDREADPYNIQRGFLWAHIGWIFFEEVPGTREHSNVRDLEKSRLVRLQARFYVLLAASVGLGVRS